MENLLWENKLELNPLVLGDFEINKFCMSMDKKHMYVYSKDNFQMFFLRNISNEFNKKYYMVLSSGTTSTNN